MRLFIAIEFDDKVKNAVERASCKLRELSDKGTFSKRDTFHITLEFLGETEPDKVEAVKEAMDAAATETFMLRFGGAGAFSSRDGNVWWVGVEPSQKLLTLQKKLASELSKRGFSVEKRAYKPHITIGRRIISRAPGLREVISKALGSVPFEVKEISLMESTRHCEGPVYKKLYGKELL